MYLYISRMDILYNNNLVKYKNDKLHQINYELVSTFKNEKLIIINHYLLFTIMEF